MKIYISITIDFDPDVATVSNERQVLEWNSFEIIPDLFCCLDEFKAPAMCFLRMDDQINKIKGSYIYLYEKYRTLWDSLLNKGHQLGLHPHLYDFCEEKRLFLPSLNPLDACRQLERIHSAAGNAGLSFQCIRMGESFHNSQLMHLVDKLGYVIDSTAIPGRVRKDDARIIDWGQTPNNPYFPSVNDHRIPGKESLNILEVPMTSMKFQAPYDEEPKVRYASLTYHPKIFQAGLLKHLSLVSDALINYLVFIIHPGELLKTGSQDPSASLYAFDVKAVRQNIINTIQAISDRGWKFEFVRLNDVRAQVESI